MVYRSTYIRRRAGFPSSQQNILLPSVRPLCLFWSVVWEMHRTMFSLTLKICCKARFSQVTHQARGTYLKIRATGLYSNLFHQRNTKFLFIQNVVSFVSNTQTFFFNLLFCLWYDFFNTFQSIMFVVLATFINCESLPIFNIKLSHWKTQCRRTGVIFHFSVCS